ncbi:nitronate monooxygenase [Pontiella sp.]|uniref:nitronate monooxygenase n=1 Tax=Pontiella sp. TaxID=2837462 RepID=UPI003562349A
MGASISNWRLAQAVSRIGQLGVVSGTGLSEVVARRLQDGDEGGHVRRALEHFPFPRMAQRILDSFYIPGGKADDVPYRRHEMQDLEGRREPLELCIVSNFVEVFLAREGHSNPVGINYLEKIQLPHLASLYGALLAGVAVVVMGAGIPLAIPAVLSALTEHEAAEYPIAIATESGGTEIFSLLFDPSEFHEEGVPLPQIGRPDFLPVVSPDALASIMVRKSVGPIDGLIVEGSLAGGHNAPPRGKTTYTAGGEPIYGLRDVANLEAFRKIGLPFWLAGSFGSAEKYREAIGEGAAGIQVGTAFALCQESGLVPDIRRELVRKALAGEATIFTDPLASPTGFPFKVAALAGTLSDPDVYAQRKRVCDLGSLRQPYRRADGKIGYRCPAEPIAAYVAKGGREEDAVGRKCLCNALIANAGMPQRLPDGGEEKCLVTMGDDLVAVERFCSDGNIDFTAADVVRVLLGA